MTPQGPTCNVEYVESLHGGWIALPIASTTDPDNHLRLTLRSPDAHVVADGLRCIQGHWCTETGTARPERDHPSGHWHAVITTGNATGHHMSTFTVLRDSVTYSDLLRAAREAFAAIHNPPAAVAA